MKTPESKPHMIHRREFLRGWLRCGGLLALGGVATVLGWRGSHGKCVRTNPCGGCPLFSGCDLPKANEAKKHKPTSDHA